jgi:nicotinamide-nucleotide amidase
MDVEVLAVGTELLLGQIVNSNAAEIGSRLADAGLDHYRQTVVGDNRERMAAVIGEAIERSDAVIITGGLGPTQDDITREAICDATGNAMAYSDEHAAHLADWWAARGREMPESNLRQAEYPTGAEFIPNLKGTAPGLKLDAGGTWVFALPGVPAELYPMLDDHVVPFLRGRAGGNRAVVSHLLRTWGESESRIADLLADLYARLDNPTLAFLASAGEIKLRITAAATTPEEAEALIAPVADEIRGLLGNLVFGVDSETIEVVLLRLLEDRGWAIACAESATGGRISSRITGVPGASRAFKGSVIAYDPAAKRDLLEVPDTVLAEHGVVSEETALAMAEGAAARLGAEVAVAVSGSAGPDPQEEPVGTMIVAVRTPQGSGARTIWMPGDRERVLTYTTTAALHLTRLAIEGAWSEEQWVPTTQ